MKKIYTIALATTVIAAIITAAIVSGLVSVNFNGTFRVGLPPPPPTEGLSISLTSRDFGTISPGSITTTSLTLTNSGTTNLVLHYTCTTGTNTPCGPISVLTGSETFTVVVRTGPGVELVNYALNAGASVNVEALLSLAPTIPTGDYSFVVNIASQ